MSTSHAAGNRIVLNDSEQVTATARDAVSSGGGSLPYLAQLQNAFGPDHDLSGIRAHVGGDAAVASEEMGACGYAAGNNVAFNTSPTLRLAAHEVAHCIAQRHGEHPSGGIGKVGDKHEVIADQIADAVDRGQSVAHLLPKGAPTAGGTSVQRFVEKEINGEPCRVSEDQTAVVMGKSNYSQDVYATAARLKETNTALASAGDKGSSIRLAPAGGQIKLGKKILLHLRPVFTSKGDPNNATLDTENKGKTATDAMALWADCGRSSRVVMGAENDSSPHAVYTANGKTASTPAGSAPEDYSDEIYVAAMPGFLKSIAAQPAMRPMLKDGVHFTGSKDNVIVATTGDQARIQYWELGEAGRRMFDKSAGINTAANPKVGGGYTMNTEYHMPGSDITRDAKGKPNMRWNFHWAGVVMKAGSDNITLENYATGGYDDVNTEWNFQMYGTVKEGQSFHDEHLGSGTHGTRASAFAVER
jgi:hypothetical protein